MSTTCAQMIVNSRRGTTVPDPYWEILEGYRAELLDQALQIVGNAADAEDVVQETFSEAFRSPAKLTQAKSLGAWLKSINRANAMDLLRSRKSSQSKIERKSRRIEKTFTTGGMSAVELHDSVAGAIEALPPAMRSIVLMHYWQHLTCEQVAAKLQMPVGTVKWHLAEAAVRLHGKLKTLFPEPPQFGAEKE